MLGSLKLGSEPRGGGERDLAQHTEAQGARCHRAHVITAARQRVEAAVGEINDNHRLFQLAWQGELAPLRDAVHVTVHTTQLAIEMGSVNATPENGYSRYADVCGPWRHDEPRH